MIIKVTVNADKRYYLDEPMIVNHGSFLATMKQFNAMKFDLYKQMFYNKFYTSGPLADGTKPCNYIKVKYGTNDYYNSAIYTAASGIVSSQVELNKLYKKTVAENIKSRDKKITNDKEQLDKYLAIKESLKTYAKTGSWVNPYPKCTIKVYGKNISLYGKKNIPIDKYELKVEANIRRLKTKISQITYGKSRKEKKLHNLTTLPPKSVIFGSKKLYSQKDVKDAKNVLDAKDVKDTKDAIGAKMAAWKKDFSFARMSSMSLPGRHTSKFCNFLCRFIKGDLHVTCMDGSECIFKDFMPCRYEDEFFGFFDDSPATRKSLCYNFTLHKDKDGRVYIIPSVTMGLENKYTNSSFASGAVGMDLNYDHIALSDVDENGKLLDSKILKFDLAHKTSGQIKNIIGNLMKEVGMYCTSRYKPLIMEDLDTTVSKSGGKYYNAKRNRHMSLFAYDQMTASIHNQSYRLGFEVHMINPAYTSQIGKILYMRKYGLSIHQAASYTIALKGMEITNLLAPPSEFIRLLPEDKQMDTLWHQWPVIASALKSVRTHAFYYETPFASLKDKKRPTLKMLANAMNNLYNQNLNSA